MHAFPGSLQPPPFHMKLGFETPQLFQFFDNQFFFAARHGVSSSKSMAKDHRVRVGVPDIESVREGSKTDSNLEQGVFDWDPK
jgi:hypothetical protein